MKTALRERDAYGNAKITSALASWTVPSEGKGERFDGYLLRTLNVPLAIRLAQSGQKLDVVSSNVEMVHRRRNRTRAAFRPDRDSLGSKQAASAYKIPDKSRFRLVPPESYPPAYPPANVGFGRFRLDPAGQ